MTNGGGGNSADAARAAAVGRTISRVSFVDDSLEVQIGDVILTGMTQPFGMIGCMGVQPTNVQRLVGRTVDFLTIVDGQYVAIDTGENRLAFPIGGSTATGPESLRLVRPVQTELGLEKAMWVW